MSAINAVAHRGTAAGKLLDKLSIRSQFPALSKCVNGQVVAFLDGPGGTQVPKQVIDAVSNYYANNNANADGVFATSLATNALVEEGRLAMSDFLGCHRREIVFGANMTTLTYALSRAFGRDLTRGDQVLTTILDHDANVSPWKALEVTGATVLDVAIRKKDCTLDLNDLANKLTNRTKLVAVGLASNAVGTINDIKNIVKMAHDAGALAYIDAVHYAPHGPIDVQDLNCDFLVCSPYKFFGPHMGVLYGKNEHLARLNPYKVRAAAVQPPECWETGTQNFEATAGLIAAIDYLAEIGSAQLPKDASRRERLLAAMNIIRDYERALSEHMIAGLNKINGVSIYGITEPELFHWRTPTFGFNIRGQTPIKVASRLAESGINIWNGNFFALQLTEQLHLEETGGMVRVGAVHYNTIEELDRCLNALESIK